MPEVGQILKPQGIRGEVKVKTSDPSRFCVLRSVEINGKTYEITSARASGGDAYVKFDGIDDRNAAELLRGATLTIAREAAPPLEKDEFYVADIVGARLVAVYPDGTEKEMGEVSRVDAFGAADVFTVRNGEKGFSFPFLKALDVRFEEAERVMKVDGKRLREVAVYED